MDLYFIIWYGWLGMATWMVFSLFLRAWYISRYTPKLLDHQIPVSVVVAARNEGANLEQLIATICSQKHEKFELIIVLDRCTDNSLEIMKALELKYKNLRTIIVDYLPDHFSPKKFALTLGIKGANHECVLLTDADCIPTSDQWISKMSAHFTRETDFVLGYAPHNHHPSLLNRFIQYETFLTGLFYLSSAIIAKPYMAVGRNLIIRKSRFLEINGYNRFQHIQGGDDDLLIHYHATRANTQICMEESAQTKSEAKSTWTDYYYQKIRHLGIGKYYSQRSKLRHSINWLVSISLWVSFCILAFVRLDFIGIYLSFFGYILMKGLTYWMVKRKMDKGFSLWSFPVFEITHLFLMPVFAIGGRITTKVKWK